MHFFRLKRVRCQNCGFLGLVPVSPKYIEDPLVDFSWETIEEIPPHWRETLHYISAEHSPKVLGCYRLQFHQLKCFTMDTHETISDEAVKLLVIPRRCDLYYKYHPGYSPVEHKELERESLNRRATLRSNIISAIIGAALATVVNIIWNLVR